MYVDIDLETRSPVDLKKCGLAKYARSSETEILCSVHEVNGKIYKNNTDNLRILANDPSIIFRAHNAAFEKEILFHQLDIDIPIERWRCSAALAASFNLPRALGPVGYCLQLNKQKDDEGKKVMLKMCKPLPIRQQKNNEVEFCDMVKGDWSDPRYHLKKESYQILVDYCVDDVLSEKEIFDRLGELPEFEQRLWERDYKMNFEMGMPLDVELCKAAVKVSDEIKDQVTKECEDFFGFSPTQISKITEFCDLPDGRAETVAEALKNTDDEAERKLLTARQTVGNTSVKKYEKALEMEVDGHVYGTMLYHGAGQTGRWAGRGLQVQNFPRGSFDEDTIDDQMADTVAKIKRGECHDMELIKSATRGMVHGNLAVCDYSAIEARVLAWGAEQTDVISAFEDGKDLYKVAASQIYGVAYDDVTKKQRQIGKIAILALGYQGGKGAFLGMAAVYGLDNLDESFCQDIVKAWRKSNHKIVSMWYKFQQDAIDAVTYGERHGCFEVIDGFLHLFLPSGRSIKYFKPKIMDEPKFGTPALTFITEPTLTDQVAERKRIEGATLARVFTYGGKLVQGWTQATARDLLADAMMKGPEDMCSMLVHDEIVSTTQPLSVLEECMLDLPEWAEGLPIAVDGWEGPRYRK